MSATSTERFHRIDSVFDAAVDLPDVERAAFIDRECGDDEELRAGVVELLSAYHRSDSALESPAAHIARPFLDAAAVLGGPVPDRIGPFRVVREIGRGGMGRVFLGERADGQFDQRVAIKLIQHGAPGILRRFIEERRILALLQHSGIARLLDGGLTSAGVPYFAMELIDGEPIDRYCETHDLTLDDRLALFASVCDAVTYAHRHLIIHRDLKPSNILVTAAGQVKLLDFGIAKVLGAQQLDDDATRTEFRALTPEFAAPEQLRGGAVSTATDVYSLGVLLYLLLTGERPYDVRGKSAADVERIVCVDVPPKPSARVRGPLARRLRGDLDLIVMTALQKEEGRRYQSPAALADDLDRFRRSHAIIARPDSRRYRLRKFLGRHRVGAAAAALLVLALAGAASRERVLRQRAEVQARKATEVERFLVRVFDVADPNSWTERDAGSVTARELLDRGVRRIDSTLTDQPEVQAELRSVLGRVYTNLGLYDKATLLLQRSLAQRTSLYGASDTSVAATLDLLGVALTKLDRYGEAEPLLRRALEQRRRSLGSTHPATAETIDHLATLLEERNEFGAAEPLYREVLAINQSRFGDASVEVANAQNNLGLNLYRRGVYAGAESLYQRSLATKLQRLGENHALTAATMQNLAQTLQTLARFEEAETYHRRALAAKRKTLGDAHPSVTISLNNLANLLTRLTGRLDEAEALAREALTLDRRMFGEQHSYVAASLGHLALVMRSKGDFVGADSLLRRALAINRTLLGEPHERVANNLGSIAQTRYLMGDSAGAIDFMRRSVAQYRASLGDHHRATVIMTGNLAYILAEVGDPREAESLARASSSRLDPAKREHRTPFISNQIALGKAVLAQGRVDDALPMLERAVEMATKEFGEGHFRTGEALLTYGRALVAKRRYADAEPVLRGARAALEKHRKAQPRSVARAAAALAALPTQAR